jgi:SOS-response transcriptional repressor LexA
MKFTDLQLSFTKKEEIKYDYMSLEIKTKTTGFGSPAESYVDKRLDLNELIPFDLMTTYYFKYAGASKLGINTGDILVVDKSIQPEIGDLVLIKSDKIILETFNNQTEIWGTITWSLSQKKK